MCHELGLDHSYMEEFVEEAGNTSLCNTKDGTHCDERSIQFLTKVKAQDIVSWEAQVDRLVGLEAGNMKADLKDWVKKRKKILLSLLADRDSKSEL